MTVRFGRSSKAVKEVDQLETAPFIQIRKKVQALWVTAGNRAVLSEQPDIGDQRGLRYKGRCCWEVEARGTLFSSLGKRLRLSGFLTHRDDRPFRAVVCLHIDLSIHC